MLTHTERRRDRERKEKTRKKKRREMVVEMTSTTSSAADVKGKAPMPMHQSQVSVPCDEDEDADEIEEEQEQGAWKEPDVAEEEGSACNGVAPSVVVPLHEAEVEVDVLVLGGTIVAASCAYGLTVEQDVQRVLVIDKVRVS